MFTTELNQLRQEIIDILSIDIDLLFQKIDEVNQQPPKSHNPLDEEKKFLLCLYLRGYTNEQIIQRYQQLELTVTKDDLSNQIRNVREGTAYDSALMLAKALDKFNSLGEGDRYKFCTVLQEYKQNANCQGVTGKLQFNNQGDRLKAPVNLVGIVREHNKTSNQIEYYFRSILNKLIFIITIISDCLDLK